jgi:tRNA(Ile)-lysidine synthetase-like protein
MLHILGKIPKEPFVVACSGGVDSMVLVDFLLRFPKNRFKLAYFNHGTSHGKDAEDFLKDFSTKKKIELVIGNISREKLKKESMEEYWRNERYSFLDSLKLPVATAQHLNDCVETWIFSSLRGFSKLIPYQRNLVFRPLLATSKSSIIEWSKRNEVIYVDDPSNESSKYSRNFIRNEMMEMVLKINPGIDTMIKKKLLERGV